MYAADQKATCDIWEQYWDPQHYLLDLHGNLCLKFVKSLLYVSSSSILKLLGCSCDDLPMGNYRNVSLVIWNLIL